MKTPHCSANAACAITNSNPAIIINFFILIFNCFFVLKLLQNYY